MKSWLSKILGKTHEDLTVSSVAEDTQQHSSLDNLFRDLGIPRIGSVKEEMLAQQHSNPGGRPVDTLNVIICEEIARDRPVDNPFVFASNGTPEVVVRMEVSPDDEQLLGGAVRDSKTLLVPVFAYCPTCPVLGLKFRIYDRMSDPYTVEGSRDLRDGDVQDFLDALLRTRSGNFHLFFGPEARRSAKGTFSFRPAPFNSVQFPYQATNDDVARIMEALGRAAKHLASIPEGRRDFRSASAAYLQNTSL